MTTVYRRDTPRHHASVCRFTALPSNLVGPIHDLGIGNVRAVQNFLRGRLCRQRELFLSDQRDELMAFAAPGVAHVPGDEDDNLRESDTHPANSTAPPTPPLGCQEN